ncbi:MAG: hypothetical protein AAGJ79_11160, partial [Verrucomicrobiota bacterium]
MAISIGQWQVAISVDPAAIAAEAVEAIVCAFRLSRTSFEPLETLVKADVVTAIRMPMIETTNKSSAKVNPPRALTDFGLCFRVFTRLNAGIEIMEIMVFYQVYYFSQIFSAKNRSQ